jgi:hypothetical protein
VASFRLISAAWRRAARAALRPRPGSSSCPGLRAAAATAEERARGQRRRQRARRRTGRSRRMRPRRSRWPWRCGRNRAERKRPQRRKAAQQTVALAAHLSALHGRATGALVLSEFAREARCWKFVSSASYSPFSKARRTSHCGHTRVDPPTAGRPRGPEGGPRQRHPDWPRASVPTCA